MLIGILACSRPPAPPNYARRLRVTSLVRLLDLIRACHLNRCRENNGISGETALDFALPADLVAYLAELDRFIAREIKPIEEADDNIRFFDHRREWARTDFENGGLPRRGWEAPLRRVKKPADQTRQLRLAIPKRHGGKEWP